MHDERRRTAPLSFCGYAGRVSRIGRVALLLAVIGLAALAIGSGFPLCPMAGTFGVPCPGCGLTRATLALLRGDVSGALKLHPLVWLLTPLFVTFMGAATFELLRDPETPRRPSRVAWNARGVTLLAAFVLVMSLGVWLARFAGHFGGPVAVTSLSDWLRAR